MNNITEYFKAKASSGLYIKEFNILIGEPFFKKNGDMYYDEIKNKVYTYVENEWNKGEDVKIEIFKDINEVKENDIYINSENTTFKIKNIIKFVNYWQLNNENKYYNVINVEGIFENDVGLLSIFPINIYLDENYYKINNYSAIEIENLKKIFNNLKIEIISKNEIKIVSEEKIEKDLFLEIEVKR
jgi:hypothetical protein